MLCNLYFLFLLSKGCPDGVNSEIESTEWNMISELADEHVYVQCRRLLYSASEG